MLRSAYFAQELLTTFEKDIGEVVLIPCKGESGTFIIRIDGNQVWNRKNESTPGFPDVKDLKQIVRDIISPSKSLGHSDVKKVIEL
jgi:selenoprotein W-related protein